MKRRKHLTPTIIKGPDMLPEEASLHRLCLRQRRAYHLCCKSEVCRMPTIIKVGDPHNLKANISLLLLSRSYNMSFLHEETLPTAPSFSP